MHTTARRIARLSALVLVLALTLSVTAGCRLSGESGAFPDSWTKKAESGEISSLCFGSWAECGTIHHTFDTHSSPSQAASELATTARERGWRSTTRAGMTGGTAVQLTNPDEDEQITVSFDGNLARAVETHR